MLNQVKVGWISVAKAVSRLDIGPRLPKCVPFGFAVTVLLIGTLPAAASPATARKQPIGNVTCEAGGTLSFSPPLTPMGMRGGHEKVILNETLTGCTGSPGTNVPASPQSIKTKPIRLRATSTGGKKVVGACPVFASQLSQAPVTQKIKWGKVNGVQTAVVVGHEGEEIFTDQFGRLWLVFKGSRSEGEPINVSLALTRGPSEALQKCMTGSGGPISSVAFDPTISFMTEGTTVLTTGSVAGTNVTTGDVLSSRVVGGPACTSASAQAAVDFNPAVPGTATLQLTSLIFSNCSIDMGPGVGTLPATVVVNGLPYSMSLSDGSGDPATLGIVSLTVSVEGGSSSCGYASPTSLTGSYDNGTASITFGGALAFTGGSGPLSTNCPSSPLNVPTFTSVADSSQSGSPAVFVTPEPAAG